MKIEHQKTDRT